MKTVSSNSKKTSATAGRTAMSTAPIAPIAIRPAVSSEILTGPFLK